MQFITLLSAIPLLTLALAAPTTPNVTVSPQPQASGSSTENQLSGPCRNVTLIYARGTNEDGNVGTVAGPPFFTKLWNTLGEDTVAVQGVDYDATVSGYLAGGSAAGSTKMLNLINKASTKCPDTNIVISGYSQGAQLVHNAAKKLTTAVTNRIVAVVVFGDPDNGDAVGSIDSSLVKSFCHDQDVVCTGSGGYTTHLTYGKNAAAAAAFVVAHDGL